MYIYIVEMLIWKWESLVNLVNRPHFSKLKPTKF